MHDPAVLILDEPTDGLDPNQKLEVRSLINAMAKDKTIIVSTHILEEVHAVCSRAIIIARGRILADATPGRTRGALALSPGGVADHGQCRRGEGGAVARRRCRRGRDRSAGLTASPRFRNPGKQIFAPISELLRAQGIEVSELQLESGRMDEVFRTITQGDLGEEAPLEEVRA